MKTFETRIREYLKDRGWEHMRPSDLAKSIMIEGAELLELFQWENLPPEEIKKNEEKMNKIKKELADVMIYCFDMAVVLDLDVEDMLNKKLDKVIEKYPTEIFNASGSGNTNKNEEYWKIKESYRKEGKN